MSNFDGRLASNGLRLVLASASPRRRELLSSVGLQFEIVPSDIPEILDLADGPAEGATNLALAKAEALGRDFSKCVILGADTIVVLGEVTAHNDFWSVLGKPKDRADAGAMLRMLSGKEHSVFTGYAVIHKELGFRRARAVETRVRFREISEKHLELYLAEGEWSDKAGAYAIQGVGASLIASINGSYTNVIGLPLSEVLDDLFGALRLDGAGEKS